LAFKVMRLNRPSFHQAGFTAGLQALRETASDQAEQATGHLPHSDAEGCPSENLLLPTGFGNIYLGETFTAYISACNTSGSRLMRLEIRAEIQTGTKRVPLLDGKPETVLAQFESNQQVDYIVSHELKEAGVHIMICSGSYLDASGEEKKVRQYFKFQVQKPLSVTTKLHFLQNSIFLENQIQNTTRAPLFLDTVKFEPTSHYTRIDLNDLTTSRDDDPSKQQHKEVPLRGAETFLKPGDVRQFLYQLVPQRGFINPADKKMEDLGRLEMAWKSAFGEPGRLHSMVNMQQWKLPPTDDVHITVAKVPSKVYLESPFTLELRVINVKAELVSLLVETNLDPSGAISIFGVTESEATVLPLGAEATVRIDLIALTAGLRTISAHQICLLDESSRKKFHLAHDLQIWILPSDKK